MHPGCSKALEISNKNEETPVSMPQLPQFQAFETENLNPSGFFCESDGTFKVSEMITKFPSNRVK